MTTSPRWFRAQVWSVTVPALLINLLASDAAAKTDNVQRYTCERYQPMTETRKPESPISFVK